MADIKFEIKETVGTLSEGSKGWKKELNLISWNDKEAKYDIRDWDSEHKKMGKGVTLTLEELRALKEILSNMELKLETWYRNVWVSLKELNLKFKRGTTLK